MNGKEYIDEIYALAEEEGLELLAGVFEADDCPIVVCRTAIKFEHAIAVSVEIIKSVVLALLEAGNNADEIKGAWVHALSQGIEDARQEWVENRGN